VVTSTPAQRKEWLENVRETVTTVFPSNSDNPHEKAH